MTLSPTPRLKAQEPGMPTFSESRRWVPHLKQKSKLTCPPLVFRLCLFCFLCFSYSALNSLYSAHLHWWGTSHSHRHAYKWHFTNYPGIPDPSHTDTKLTIIRSIGHISTPVSYIYILLCQASLRNILINNICQYVINSSPYDISLFYRQFTF